ncbi:hypothetical protein, partial [Nocardioides sp.]|uniref:hypothetical protein n=1 Tax=Nocardioides sp. TaxID=35761 RepID=UPI002733D1DF
VDSPTSQAGGRELWGIPKQLADFGDPDHDERSATVRGEEIASARFRPARPPALPLPVPLPARTIQTLAGATVASRLLMRGRLRWARAAWDLPRDGELAWLRDAIPVASAVAPVFALRFGPRLSG